MRKGIFWRVSSIQMVLNPTVPTVPTVPMVPTTVTTRKARRTRKADEMKIDRSMMRRSRMSRKLKIVLHALMRSRKVPLNRMNDQVDTKAQVVNTKVQTTVTKVQTEDATVLAVDTRAQEVLHLQVKVNTAGLTMDHLTHMDPCDHLPLALAK